MASPGRILVFRVGQLGDTLVSLPALWTIRERHPDSGIVLLTDNHPGRDYVSSWEILERTGIFSSVATYDANVSMWSGWPGRLRLALQIRRLQPERLYYLAPARRTIAQIRRDAFFFRTLCGIKDVIGMPESESVIMPRDAHGKPERLEAEYDRLFRLAGGTGPASRFDIPISEREKASIDLIWRDHKLNSSGEVIAMAPGAKYQAKRWPADRYLLLGKQLLAAVPDSSILLVGGREDSNVCAEVNRGLGSRAVYLAGRLTVLESGELLRRCSLYVGNDSGPMHLAAISGTPCVALFSARDNPGIWEPFGDNHIILRRDVPCAGCLLTECEENALRCLTEIGVEDVLQACVSLLSAQRKVQ